MYEEYWGLKEKPFENTPDPRFLYSSGQHDEALSRLVYVVRENKGAGMLTGVFGCGKTLLGRSLLGELEKDVYKVAYLTNPRMEDIDLLRVIAHHLGSPELPVSKSDILISLEKTFANNMRDGKKTVIIIDEAHVIEKDSVFEEIRLLLNYQLEDKFLLTLLLLGQPELKDKVESNKQLLQRIAMRYHLKGLTQGETEKYIKHRLNIAGSTKDIFAPEALRLAFVRSAGIPRRINQICDMSLLTGFSKKVNTIDESIVIEGIESLER